GSPNIPAHYYLERFRGHRNCSFASAWKRKHWLTHTLGDLVGLARSAHAECFRIRRRAISIERLECSADRARRWRRTQEKSGRFHNNVADSEQRFRTIYASES